MSFQMAQNSDCEAFIARIPDSVIGHWSLNSIYIQINIHLDFDLPRWFCKIVPFSCAGTEWWFTICEWRWKSNQMLYFSLPFTNHFLHFTWGYQLWKICWLLVAHTHTHTHITSPSPNDKCPRIPLICEMEFICLFYL